MRFYYLNEKYVAYLKSFDSSVCDNKHQTRPYIGVVLQINGFDYYVPLSSPKPKHRTMSNGKDFRKINHGVYGVINFNLMVPVPPSEVIPIDFPSLDEKYRRLLQNQLRFIKRDSADIINTARDLRKMFDLADSSLTENDTKIKNRCVNFPLLELKAKEYKQQMCRTCVV